MGMGWFGRCQSQRQARRHGHGDGYDPGGPAAWAAAAGLVTVAARVTVAAPAEMLAGSGLSTRGMAHEDFLLKDRGSRPGGLWAGWGGGTGALAGNARGIPRQPVWSCA
jgi:hypothetical protein